jgi:hypothetical protein
VKKRRRIPAIISAAVPVLIERAFEEYPYRDDSLELTVQVAS